MLYENEHMQRISTEEYFYLTENFEFVDARGRSESVRYLMYNKKKKLMDIVGLVMENELSVNERNMAIDYWYKKMSISDISKKYQISRSSFYRAIDVIKNKLNTSLKYVLLYVDAIKPPSKEDFLTQNKMEIFMGEQIDN